ncbi:SPJ_0845 family protein [Lapidilactobacillus mulanensis]|uniref:SPJ_0845 family protein n=1 Tax=Lapidilactobacillus mulanensis TaxID=2485999 RepID=A0ABW4DR57_9LACO|nr:SPJ_0845 family protein [Lapidilactobacillus mulanensis]
MGLTIKRDDKLTSLFDKFATLPEDKKDSEVLKKVTEKADENNDKKTPKKSTDSDEQPK